MDKRILRTLQNLCLTECKINLYTYDSYHYSGNTSGTFWSAIYYQEAGTMMMESPTMSLEVIPGDLLYIPIDSRYDHYSISKEGVKFYIIAFTCRESEGEHFDKRFGITKINLFKPGVIHSRIQTMFEKSAKGPEEKLLVLSDFYKLFSEILPVLNENHPAKLHPALQKALTYINDHLTENYTIKDLADYCHISESRLYHLFDEQLHTTPITYKNDMRIKASFVLLTTTDLSISEIAERMNFASTTHYRYAFRKTTNSTPKRYRKIFRLNHNNFIGY